MRNKILLLITVLLLVVYVVEGCIKRKPSFFSNEIENETIENKITIYDKKNDKYITIDFEDYIIGVVAAEMPASFDEEALKAQAVAARTYALFKTGSNKMLTTDTSTQSYNTVEQMQNKWQDKFNMYFEKIREAVIQTKDEVLKYDGFIIPAYYFSMSNGYTENSEVVFANSKPYLKSVESLENTDNKNFIVTKVISKKEFCESLGISCDNIIIGKIINTSSGRVESIVINNKAFSGIVVRKLLNLRSTDFKIELDDDVYITTTGYGHGVGMSQYGANQMAKNGSNYKDILLHYYTGVTIEKI